LQPTNGIFALPDNSDRRHLVISSRRVFVARSSIPGYTSPNSIRQKFTGKERDTESGLDYFLARYYSGAQGRFISPDEFAGGIVDPFTGQQVGQPGPLPYANIVDPQTLNKYAYVRNNPLPYTDPDGHDLDDIIEVLGVSLGEQQPPSA